MNMLLPPVNYIQMYFAIENIYLIDSNSTFDIIRTETQHFLKVLFMPPHIYPAQWSVQHMSFCGKRLNTG